MTYQYPIDEYTLEKFPFTVDDDSHRNLQLFKELKIKDSRIFSPKANIIPHSIPPKARGPF